MENEKINQEKVNECLKDLTTVLNKHGFELFPQVVISDKGVQCNMSMRKKENADQKTLGDKNAK